MSVNNISLKDVRYAQNMCTILPLDNLNVKKLSVFIVRLTSFSTIELKHKTASHITMLQHTAVLDHCITSISTPKKFSMSVWCWLDILVITDIMIATSASSSIYVVKCWHSTSRRNQHSWTVQYTTSSV